MKSSKQWLDCAQLRDMDLVSYLADAGHEPTKIRNQDYWYLSPLRQEKTASFKVNRRLNRWYDHGVGKGGNLIDFAILYHSCTITELLQSLQGYYPLHAPSFQQNKPIIHDNPVEVLGEYTISSFALISYLEERRIPYLIAARYCREIRYKLNGKIYYSMGFKNDGSGYELRNQFYKNSSCPKGMTTIRNGAAKVAVFEGFFDFLSFVSLTERQPAFTWDFCILNSLSFFERARPFLEEYESIHLFLDNDTAGQNCSSYAMALDTKYQDESSLYKNYKDLNEWVVNMGKAKI
ncbi:MAG: toprim domain-containing protein [Ferruginibacter sp.]